MGARASAGVADRAAVRVRVLCLALPETTEVAALGAPARCVRGRTFAFDAQVTAAPSRERPAVWIHERPANQRLVLEAEPARYVRPPHVGAKRWDGGWVDAAALRGSARSRQLAGLLAEAHERASRA